MKKLISLFFVSLMFIANPGFAGWFDGMFGGTNVYEFTCDTGPLGVSLSTPDSWKKVLEDGPLFTLVDESTGDKLVFEFKVYHRPITVNDYRGFDFLFFSWNDFIKQISDPSIWKTSGIETDARNLKAFLLLAANSPLAEHPYGSFSLESLDETHVMRVAHFSRERKYFPKDIEVKLFNKNDSNQ